MKEFTKFESSGRFGLATKPGGSYAPWWSNDGSLGSGSSQRVYSFSTEEAREYFIQSENASESAAEAWGKLNYAIRELGEITKKRDVRKRITKLLEGLK